MFTNQELSFISVLLAKVDPAGLIDQSNSIKEKISKYAQVEAAKQLAGNKRNGKAVKKRVTKRG